jgi:hypothetical protein
MKLEDIRVMVETDLKLNETELDIESMRIPQIHGKYLNLLFDERLMLKRHEADYSVMKRLKWEYYGGKMNQEQLDELGWEQFDLKILRQDLDKYLESDTDLVEISMKVVYQKEKVSYLDSIVKAIASLQWNIRNAIEWKKFIHGVN